jgi:hypothetical protein
MEIARSRARAFQPTAHVFVAYVAVVAASYLVVPLPGPLRFEMTNVILRLVIDSLLILGLLRGMRLAWWIALARQIGTAIAELVVMVRGHVTADRTGLVVTSAIAAAVLLRMWTPRLGRLLESPRTGGPAER